MALIPFALTACSKPEEPQQGPIKKAPPAPQAQPQTAPEAMEKSAEAEPTVDARARNPFQSYIITMRGMKSATPGRVKGPLECCDLGSFRIIAVVAAPENAYALVQSPDGKRYIVRKGDVMGAREGKVVRIDNKGITVREVIKDEEGNVTSSEDMELKLPEKK